MKIKKQLRLEAGSKGENVFNKDRTMHPLRPAPKGGKMSKERISQLTYGFHAGRKQGLSLSANPGILRLDFSLFQTPVRAAPQ